VSEGEIYISHSFFWGGGVCVGGGGQRLGERCYLGAEIRQEILGRQGTLPFGLLKMS